jgi:hypothetical protein
LLSIFRGLFNPFLSICVFALTKNNPFNFFFSNLQTLHHLRTFFQIHASLYLRNFTNFRTFFQLRALCNSE